MFALPTLVGTQPQPLPLFTQRFSKIDNVQEVAPSSACIAMFANMVGKHPSWVTRKPPTGVYNCAGLVWANRRTAIQDAAAWQLILSDDGYRRVNLQQVEVGDIGIYSLVGLNRLTHVGLVVRIDQLQQGGAKIPWLLSKFGNTGGEVMHHFNDWPQAEMYSLSFWTERP
jgi:hypothetical protein